MNPWFQNQQQLQLLAHQQQWQGPWVINGGGLRFIPVQHFPVYMQQQQFPNGPRPIHNHMHPKNFRNGPGSIHKRAKAGWRNNSSPGLPVVNSPQNVGLLNDQKTTPNSSYKANEMKSARSALCTYFDHIPESLRRWQPLAPDSEPNLWEGESGMMEHITRPFPCPVKGRVGTGAAVWRPQSAAAKSTTGQVCVNHVGKTSDKSGPKTASQQEEEDSSRDTVVVSEDDSDVEIVSDPPVQSAGNTSSAIVITDSPVAPRQGKRKQAAV